MKRRLRKKKRVGEFKELGFELVADLDPAVEGSQLDAFVERLISFVESRDLGFGGGVGPAKLDGFVSRFGRGSATEDDRLAMADFLEGDTAIVRHDVGGLLDGWHG